VRTPLCVMSCNTHELSLISFWPIPDSSNQFCHPTQLLRFLESSSTLELGTYLLLTLDIFYSKVSSLVYLRPCHHMLSIHVYFALIMFLLAPCLSPTLHLLHLHFPSLRLCHWLVYKTLILVWYLYVRISTLISVIDYSTPSWSPMKPLFWTSKKPWSLQRSSFILDLYAPLSLEYTPVQITSALPDYFRHFRNPQSPRTHLKYSDTSTR